MSRASVVSMVEKGWGGARRVSIELAEQGIAVHHYVKGRLPGDLVRVLTLPRGVRISGLPVRWYRPAVWALLAGRALLGRRTVVLVDNERAMGWVSRWRFSRAPVLVLEREDGGPLVRVAGRDADAAAVGALCGAGAG
jgi:hypothetical protein